MTVQYIRAKCCKRNVSIQGAHWLHMLISCYVQDLQTPTPHVPNCNPSNGYFNSCPTMPTNTVALWEPNTSHFEIQPPRTEESTNCQREAARVNVRRGPLVATQPHKRQALRMHQVQRQIKLKDQVSGLGNVTTSRMNEVGDALFPLLFRATDESVDTLARQVQDRNYCWV